MYRPTAGDIFSFPITPQEHLSGRVLLDVEAQCVAPARLPPDSPLVFFQGAILVEIHGVAMPRPGVGDGRVLIPSAFVAAAALRSGHWPVVGHRPVDPTELDFPPALLLVGPRPHLSWGELRLPLAMDLDELDALDVSPTLHTSALDQIALVALGREADVDRKRYRRLDALRLARSDLRFHPAAADVFSRAGLPARPRYFDEALARGLDPRRFYAPDEAVPFTVCPYCWARRTPADLCWACGEDTRRDAAIETTQDELDTTPRKTCPSCRSQIPAPATRCASCRAPQPETDDDE